VKTYCTEYTTETVPEGAFGKRFAGPDVKANTAAEALLPLALRAYEGTNEFDGIVAMEVVGHYHPGDD
jgi:hypothetical protein